MSGIMLAKQELECLAQRFAADRETFSDLEIEVDFWLAVEACQQCMQNQMCAGHYERFALCL